MDFGIWCGGVSWNQSPTDTRGQLYAAQGMGCPSVDMHANVCLPALCLGAGHSTSKPLFLSLEMGMTVICPSEYFL